MPIFHIFCAVTISHIQLIECKKVFLGCLSSQSEEKAPCCKRFDVISSECCLTLYRDVTLVVDSEGG